VLERLKIHFKIQYFEGEEEDGEEKKERNEIDKNK
jgi:hypothetical protein